MKRLLLARALRLSYNPKVPRSYIPILSSNPVISCRSVTSVAKPRRPSPYRLIPPHTFLASFAPLHVAGWRLVPITTTSHDAQTSGEAIEEGMADLQDRKLVRLYEFEMGRQGWGDLMRFMRKVGEVVAVQHHHPRVLISPAQDYVPSILEPASPQSGYLFEISTHTHTPLPALQPGEIGSKEKMRPGVTTKDLKLAEAVEEIWSNLAGGEEP